MQSKPSKLENQDIRNIKLIGGNAYDLPFEDGCLNVVNMVTVLQEISDRNRALQEIKRVLKLDGFFVVSELFPDPDYPWKSTPIKLATEADSVVNEV